MQEGEEIDGKDIPSSVRILSGVRCRNLPSSVMMLHLEPALLMYYARNQCIPPTIKFLHLKILQDIILGLSFVKDYISEDLENSDLESYRSTNGLVMYDRILDPSKGPIHL